MCEQLVHHTRVTYDRARSRLPISFPAVFVPLVIIVAHRFEFGHRYRQSATFLESKSEQNFVWWDACERFPFVMLVAFKRYNVVDEPTYVQRKEVVGTR